MKSAALLTLLAAVAILSCKSDTTAPPPPPPDIFFNIWTASGKGALMGIKADGSGMKQVVASGSLASAPAAGVMAVGDSPSVALYQTDGKFLRTLAGSAAAPAACPMLSRNGSRIACSVYNQPGAQTDSGSLFVVGADGASGQTLATNASYEFVPAPSADGNQVAYVATDGRLHIMNVDGSNVRIVQDSAWRTPGFTAGSAWSPAGDRIAYLGRSYNAPRIVMLSSSGGVSAVVSGGGTQPVWSPDGTKIAYSNGHISVANANGANRHDVTSSTDGNDTNPCWSPDGTKIIFITRLQSQAFAPPFRLRMLDVASGIVTPVMDSVAGPAYWAQ